MGDGGTGVRKDKNEMLSDIAQREVVFWTSYLYFLVKENWVCAMTTHHANNILLARNLHFDFDVRQ